MTRRAFMKTTAAAAALTGGLTDASAEELRGEIRKSLYWGMLPEDLSIREKFGIIKRAGYAGVEIPTQEKDEDVYEMKAAAQETGIVIHSIMNSKHWRSPFSSDDPAVIREGMEGMKTSLRNARDLGCDTVLPRSPP